jgi:hypothetical protein
LHTPAFFSLVRGIGLAGVIACLAPGPPVFAAKPKPDLAFKNKAATVTVLIDAALKSDPALAADLIAEGKRWADEQRAEADGVRKEAPERFKQRGFTYERTYRMRSEIAGRYVSIIRADHGETGGSNPNAELDTIIWDKHAGKRVDIRPFLTDTSDDGTALKMMRSQIVTSLTAEKKARRVDVDPERFEGIQPKLTKIGAVTLALSTESGKSSGLTFHYPPYAVGRYAEGEYVAFVPWETLKPNLTPEGARIFGGARPKGDDGGRR